MRGFTRSLPLSAGLLQGSRPTENRFRHLRPLTIHSRIRAEADRCVMCGLCLPHCPTFLLTGNEAESPRGRIVLMSALAEGTLEPDDALLGHLDRCIGCRACERMCPSGVRYGELIRDSRSLAPRSAGLGSLARSAWGRRGIELYRKSGLQPVVRATGVLGNGSLSRAEALLPTAANRRPGTEPRSSRDGGDTVTLFTGCMGPSFDEEAVGSAVIVLEAFGHAVQVLEEGCCGALDLHAGRTGAARTRAVDLVERVLDSRAVVGLASGCTAAMREYGGWLDHPEVGGFTAKVADICTFLADLPTPTEVSLRPLDEPVLVHVPCSTRNILREEKALFRLLGRIPGLQAIPLGDDTLCCGAGGDYMLRHPGMAGQLRARKIDAVRSAGARLLVSGNIGCALHLAAGLREAGLPTEVMHPVTLLARQLASG